MPLPPPHITPAALPPQWALKVRQHLARVNPSRVNSLPLDVMAKGFGVCLSFSQVSTMRLHSLRCCKGSTSSYRACSSCFLSVWLDDRCSPWLGGLALKSVLASCGLAHGNRAASSSFANQYHDFECLLIGPHGRRRCHLISLGDNDFKDA